MTYPTSSPTWRNKKDKLTDSQVENFGYLRPNEDVIELWKRTKEIAKTLKTDVCVIQTAGSFSCTEENENNMRKLFSKIDYGELTVAWEPRGDWKENQDKVKKICEDLNLIHVVDIMRRQPLSSHKTAYIRLHDLNQDEYNYNYDYSTDEIETLAYKLNELSRSHEKVYSMFNNYEMYDNAKTLEQILKE